MEVTRKEKIEQLFRLYGSDKLDHGYAEFYADLLPEKCTSMLEIGVLKGASALAWEELYGVDIDLHLLDLFMDPDNVSVKWCRRHGFIPHEGSQSNSSVLASITKQFEIIVDDGSHNAQDQLISFKHLFLNNLKTGGVYVIEDVHCNKDEFYWGDKVNHFSSTPLWMFQNFIETGGIINPYFNDGEEAVFRNIISKVEVYKDQIIFIHRV